LWVGNGGNDNDDCGSSIENCCLILRKGYSQSGGGDKHVQIYQGVCFSGVLELSSGGVYCTDGIVSGGRVKLRE
jgi:hypothetical protein